MKSTRSVFVAALLCVSLTTTDASKADLIINVFEGPSGVGVSGVFDGTLATTTLGGLITSTGEDEAIGGLLSSAPNENALLRWTRRTGLAGAQESFGIFPTARSAGTFLTSTTPDVPTQLSPMGDTAFRLQLVSLLGDNGVLTLWGSNGGAAVTSITFNNDIFFYPSWNFSDFRLGTWEWGNFDGIGVDGYQLNIASKPLGATPEPSTAIAFATGLFAIPLLRRRNPHKAGSQKASHNALRLRGFRLRVLQDTHHCSRAG